MAKNNTPLVETIYSVLKNIENKVIVIKNNDESILEDQKQFEFDNKFLMDFFESIKVKVESSNILINSIEHKQYHEIYEFKKNGFIAAYKFWYDGKGIFKKVEIITSKTTGLIEEINELLNQENK